jgi:hypothetical protein
VLFSSDGSRLVGTRVATSLIDSFAVDGDGLLTAAAGSPFAAQGLGPFGSEFRPTNPAQLYVANAHDGTNAGTVSAFTVSADGTLTPIAGSPFPDNQTAPCWVEISHDGRYLFTVNTGSKSISSYSIAAAGSLSLLQSTPLNAPAASPQDARLSPDGGTPWVADLGPDGRLGPARHVAGGPQESVVEPEWNPQGILHFVSDRSGWWNLYRERHGQVEPLLPMAAEFADAPWGFDYSSYAFVTDGHIACRYRQHGRDRLTLLDPETGRLTDLPTPYTSVKPYLRAVGDRLAFIGASPTASSAWRSWMCLLVASTSRLGPRFPWMRPGSRGLSRSSSHPGTARRPTHSITHPPTPEVTGPADARPPLLVQAHPGPTADAKARLDLRIQFFTSRGFAAVEVNYAGSTGYGRGYRERLTGQWASPT